MEISKHTIYQKYFLRVQGAYIYVYYIHML